MNHSEREHNGTALFTRGSHDYDCELFCHVLSFLRSDLRSGPLLQARLEQAGKYRSHVDED